MIKISDYTYDLPHDRIALFPLPERDQSKLLVYRNGVIDHSAFQNLPDLIPPGSALFFNNTRVIPARLLFQNGTGARIEIFLLDPVWPSPVISLAMDVRQKSRWHCTIGNLKKWKDADELRWSGDGLTLQATLVDRKKSIVAFSWSPAIPFSQIVQKAGVTPLPPYIKRDANASDQSRYQTVYSTEEGAVAAPTAGLHFTEQVMQSLRDKGTSLHYLTLHVSAGTFLPVKTEDASQHVMHQEQVVITRANLEDLRRATTTIAVGTTSLRTVESIYWYGVKLLKDPDAPFQIHQHDAYQLEPVGKSDAVNAVIRKMEREQIEHLMGETAIYIVPGYHFKMTDILVTNFHQPGSTLMLLVAAFVGKDWRNIYDEALNHGYRFLSYGDSSLLFRAG